VRTSYDGKDFSTARVTWEHHGAPGPFDDSWSEGTFRFNKAFRAIRLSFRGTVVGGPVGVGELEFGRAPTTRTIEKIKPLEIWLDMVTSAPPRLRMGGHPVEARFLPWLCWGFGMTGLLGPGLAQWPNGWTVDSAATEPAWQGHGNGEGFLLYPTPGKPAPSIRLERLRDGIEDHESLAALERAVAATRISDPQTARLCTRLPFRPDLSPADLDAIARTALDSHVRIGRALTALVKPSKAKKKEADSVEAQPTPPASSQ